MTQENVQKFVVNWRPDFFYHNKINFPLNLDHDVNCKTYVNCDPQLNLSLYEHINLLTEKNAKPKARNQ